MDFNDPPDATLMNSVEFWDPYYLNKLFCDEVHEGSYLELLNSSISDLELLDCVEKIERELYQPLVINLRFWSYGLVI